MKTTINVTKTFLPKQETYNSLLKKSWDKRWITNRGDLVIDLEKKIKSYLGVNYIIATTNGTLPLQIAIKTLKLKGEIITTPFSYVATTSSIVWENCKPVFVDIDSDYLTIDESLIEKKITEKTSAILVTHVFGNPCNIEKIEQIAKKNNLKVIYDAAHCFGVKYNNESIFNFGDISTCSFHATKIFHTGEGGAIFTNNKELHEKLYHHHNFGHKGTEEFHSLGINAKMSEFQAAMGLSVLPHFNEILKNRKLLYNYYLELLEKENNIKFQKIRENTTYNYPYFPIILNDEKTTLNIIAALNSQNIFPRRYFYPSLETLPYVKGEFEVNISSSISKRILCLPLYYGLMKEDLKTISTIILNNL